MTLREEIQNSIGEWLNVMGLSYDDKDCEVLEDTIMRLINKKAHSIDVGEMIKSLMWEKRKTFTYGDISEFIEKRIVEEFK
jgi:hypothetical protein